MSHDEEAGLAVAGEGAPAAHGAPAEGAGHALFSPFGSVGMVVQPLPVASMQAPEGGDWSLPVSVTVAGLVALGWMVRVILH